MRDPRSPGERYPVSSPRVPRPLRGRDSACGNDRGAPGADHIPWETITAALHAIGYDGAVAIESFTPDDQTIARAAAIWRPPAETQDALAKDGLAFLVGALA
jgi:D-psicose/D-tagatose/L-ribulose 3-epimerase